MPSETPPSRVKNAWRMFCKVKREPAWIMLAGMTAWPSRVKSGQRPELGIGNRQRLEQIAHLIRRRQTRECRVDIGRLLRCRIGFQPHRALFDAEAAEEFALTDRTMRDSALALGPTHDGGEIDLRGQIGFAGIF